MGPIDIGILVGVVLMSVLWGVTEMTLENIDHVSQLLLLCVAVGALIYASKQIGIARDSNQQSLEVARATFLLQLESRWAGNELLEARYRVDISREKILKIIAQNHPHIDDATRKTKLQTQFADNLWELRKGDEDQRELYNTMMRFCSFFEFVGYMVKNNDIRFSTAMDMFLGPITLIDSCFRNHINARQKETGVPAGLYEHALFLADEAKKLDQTSKV